MKKSILIIYIAVYAIIALAYMMSVKNDKNKYEAKIQKSSLATDDAIWLGIDNPQITIFEDENMGKFINTTPPKNWRVCSRMHLNREQVAELIPILQKFVETGEL